MAKRRKGSRTWHGRWRPTLATKISYQEPINQHKLNHRKYIQGPVWESFKQEYFSKYLKECAVCLVTVEVDLHHKSYERIHGKEQFEDVVPLCRKHHTAVHEYHKARGGSLLDNSNEFVQAERARRGLEPW